MIWKQMTLIFVMILLMKISRIHGKLTPPSSYERGVILDTSLDCTFVKAMGPFVGSFNMDFIRDSKVLARVFVHLHQQHLTVTEHDKHHEELETVTEKNVLEVRGTVMTDLNKVKLPDIAKKVEELFLLVNHKEGDNSTADHHSKAQHKPSPENLVFDEKHHGDSWEFYICPEVIVVARHGHPIAHFDKISALIEPPTHAALFCANPEGCLHDQEHSQSLYLVTRALLKHSLPFSPDSESTRLAHEDPKLLNVREHLQSPPASEERKVVPMFIGVLSAPQYFDRRAGVREAWFQEVRKLNMDSKFFLGRHKDENINKQVQEEAEKYQDVVIVPMDDDYYSITQKTAAIFVYAHYHYDAKYIMKCDDDTYVFAAKILSFLQGIAKQEYIYTGTVSMHAQPSRDPHSQWYVPTTEMKENHYPPFAHGPGYVVSQDLSDFFVAEIESQNHHLVNLRLEDVSVGFWVDHAINNHHLPINIVPEPRFKLVGCSSKSLIGHYINPTVMRTIWKTFQQNPEHPC